MKPHTKAAYKSGILAGIIYASLMAGFDFSTNEEFLVWKYLINALFFGAFMGVFMYYSQKKKAEKKEES